jgi:acetylglutamate kinase
MLTVVKIGGAWLEAGAEDEAFRALAALPGDLVVMHGGGREISRWLERSGIDVEWIDGLRVTRGDSLQLTAMVLSGWVNKRVVEALVCAGRPAVGISGEDGGLLSADPLDRDRLGEVGRIREVRPDVLRVLMSGGYTPVISPISSGPEGRPLNVNADEAAIPLAIGISADRLLLLSDVPGVLSGGRRVEALDRSTAAALAKRGDLVGGMRVKVDQALAAAEAGVEVRIGDASLLTGDPGTRISGSELSAAST